MRVFVRIGVTAPMQLLTSVLLSACEPVDPGAAPASPAAATTALPTTPASSPWGSRTPLTNKEPDPAQSIAQSKGKIWMQPIAAQDVRPRSGVYTEAQNTENLRVSWAKAISSGADWVQIPTWNDYSEGTKIAPSTHIGYVYLDLCSYYLTWFKTGAAPSLMTAPGTAVATVSGQQQTDTAPAYAVSTSREPVELVESDLLVVLEA